MNSTSRLRIVRNVASPLLLLLIWQLWGASQPQRGGPPVPVRVVAAAKALISSGDLHLALLVSIQRVLWGFLIAVAIAIPLGLLMGYFRAVERNLDPIVQTFRSVAPIALVPLSIVWFGTGNISAIFIVAYGAVFPLLINTISGVKEVDATLVRVALTMGLSKGQILRRVILPGSLPLVFVGIRLSMGVAWGAIVAAELAVGAKSGALYTGGIGQMLFRFYAYSVEMNSIVVCMITIGLVALVIDRGLRVLQAKLMPWALRRQS